MSKPKRKQLARWIYWENSDYYCRDCIEIRMDEINLNKEFSNYIDYEDGETCGYCEDYADEDHSCYCCRCGQPLYSNVDKKFKK